MVAALTDVIIESTQLENPNASRIASVKICLHQDQAANTMSFLVDQESHKYGFFKKLFSWQ